MTWGVAFFLATVAQAKGQTDSLSGANLCGNQALPTLAIPKASESKSPTMEGINPYPWEPVEQNNSLWKPLFNHLLSDQHAIWTSPEHLRLGDASWLLPIGGLTAGLFATDQQFSRHLSSSPRRIKHFDDFSNYGTYAMVGGAGAMYLWGHLTHNEHLRETGFLSGEALIDSLLTTEAFKYSFRRARPADPGAGEFWHGGTSFPSEHSTAAWALAGVIAHEYPGPLTKLLTYGLASAISASRVGAKEHFPSDVLVGGLIGYLVSRHVYLAHHDPDLSGGTWRLFPHSSDSAEKRQPGNMGSPYVPLDSWVYAAFERLAALGYINTEFLGMRPWTRLECARLVEEASDHLSAQEKDPPTASRLVQSLEKEFTPDIKLLGGARNQSLELESVYTRVTGIAGQPLTHGYNFGQTIINDYGRPYGEGFNNVTGFTGWASSGPFTAYLDGEYQHAPAVPPLPLAARQFISQADYGLPLEPADPTPEVNRFRALDAYVAMNFENWQISFGKQSLWWGPGEGGAMMFTNNAEPVTMLRISQVTPFRLPSILGLIGPMRTEFFLGRLSGQQFVYGTTTGLVGQWGQPLSNQPMVHGEKISFKPTPNLEFGVSVTAVFAGPGVPFTAATLFRTFTSAGTMPGCLAISPTCPRIDAGDRRGGFDMTYRLPFLRNRATFYTDSFTDDEISPLAYWGNAANSAGLYFPHLPKLPKFDLRLEGVYTDNPTGTQSNNLCCGFYYSNGRYRNGYTNDGSLIGSWIGRDGQGEQAWLTYWRTPRSYLQFQFRHQMVAPDFVPGGGTINDGGVKASLWLGQDLSASALLQYEKWRFPVLRPGSASDFTSSVQLTYWPHWRWH